jgi:hypothetical protein
MLLYGADFPLVSVAKNQNDWETFYFVCLFNHAASV